MDRSIGSPRTRSVVGVRGPWVSVFGLPVQQGPFLDFAFSSSIDVRVYVEIKMRVEPFRLCACEKRYFVHLMMSTRPNIMKPPVNGT